MREAAQIEAADAYFKPRSEIDNPAARRLFEAGFERAWNRCRPLHPNGIPEAMLQAIVDGMPGGVHGYLTNWGWLQFARQVEWAQGIGEQP